MAKVARARGLRLFLFHLRKRARANGWPEAEINMAFKSPFIRFNEEYESGSDSSSDASD